MTWHQNHARKPRPPLPRRALPLYLPLLQSHSKPERDQALHALKEIGPACLPQVWPLLAAKKLAVTLADYWESRSGTAAGLLAINDTVGETFYDVPKAAALDRAAADEALGGDELVIDVQTHFVAPISRIFG